MRKRNNSAAVKSPSSTSHLLLFRFSALGDIAMTIPVIDSLARRHPATRITVVSRPFAAPLFAALPANVHFVGADLKGRHKGLAGLWRLSRELLRLHPTAVADLHDVLRTKVLRLLLSMSGLPVAHIRKGRAEKRRLVAKKERRQLPSTFGRYADVLHRLGFAFDIDFRRLRLNDFSACERAYGAAAGDEWRVGIAPLAAHPGKTYPPERMLQALTAFSRACPQARLFVFCSRREADGLRETWQRALPDVRFVCDALHDLGEELQLMASLRLMVSMDSANMHLASLVGVPVVSIWGQTHPFAGFLGYGQDPYNALQCALDCRPCSIYGNRPCTRPDLAEGQRPEAFPCLDGIAPAHIARRMQDVLAEGRE